MAARQQVHDAEYLGEMDNWAAAANRMAAHGLLTPSDTRMLRLLEGYGILIANTDRLDGNISLLLAAMFWQAAASDNRVSERFRVIAAQNLGPI